MKKSNTKITDWLDEHGTKESDRFIEINLFITESVFNEMDNQGLNTTDLANKMNLHTSQVHDMLTGLYVFTLKDIVKLEIVLGISLFNVEGNYSNKKN